MKFCVITISDRVSRNEYEDLTGPALGKAIEAAGWKVVKTLSVSDDLGAIIATLEAAAASDEIDVVVTNGGTGIGKRDVTPEATRAVIDRDIPGLAEAMRSTGRTITPLADLARQVVGHKDNTLIMNVPGSPKGAVESFNAISAVLPHAVELLSPQ